MVGWVGKSVMADVTKATGRLSVTWPIHPGPQRCVRKTFSTYFVTLSHWKNTLNYTTLLYRLFLWWRAEKAVNCGSYRFHRNCTLSFSQRCKSSSNTHLALLCSFLLMVLKTQSRKDLQAILKILKVNFCCCCCWWCYIILNLKSRRTKKL